MPHPIFLLILNALYKGFQMRNHLFQKFFGKLVKIKETSFLSTRGIILMFGNCICSPMYFAPRLYALGFLIWNVPLVMAEEICNCLRQVCFYTERLGYYLDEIWYLIGSERDLLKLGSYADLGLSFDSRSACQVPKNHNWLFDGMKYSFHFSHFGLNMGNMTWLLILYLVIWHQDLWQRWHKLCFLRRYRLCPLVSWFSVKAQTHV